MLINDLRHCVGRSGYRSFSAKFANQRVALASSLVMMMLVLALITAGEAIF
jgi:hypothetical protein